MSGAAHELERRTAEWFAGCPGAVVAFSAGVDSSLVAALALRHLGAARTLAVMSDSPSLKRSDLAAGRAFCAEHGVPLRVITTGELAKPEYASNPVDRCYFCKSTLYGDLGPIAAARPGWWVLNGQNADDAGDYRPGIRAADEAAVRRPLAELGMGKAAVRGVARAMGLGVWDKPASPCLSSRVPYGQAVTLEKLRRIEAAESAVQAMGFEVCRVRHDGDEGAVTARVEVPSDRVGELRAAAGALRSALLPLGFASVAVDDEGFVSGKLNRAVPVALRVMNGE